VPTITTLQRGKKGIITTKQQQHKESFQKEDFGDLGSIEFTKMKEQSWSVVGQREDGDTRSFH
jgi:hypothetical protein